MASLRTITTMLTTCIAAMSISAMQPTIDLPAKSPVADGYGLVDSVAAQMSLLPLDPLEGIWEFSGDGAIVAIEREREPRRFASASYRLTAISMPDRSVAPGTLIGRAVTTASDNKFDAAIYTKAVYGLLQTPSNFIMTLTADGRLLLSHYRQGVKLNLWRMVPYMFRYSVKGVDERPKGIDGMIKLYPTPSKPKTSPRYL